MRSDAPDPGPDGLPMSIAYTLPDAWDAVPDGERARRCRLNDPHDPDLCVIDGERFFLRGNLEIPVRGVGEPFVYGVWVTLGRADCRRTIERWKAEGREAEPPVPGRLATALAGYPSTTLDLAARVRTRRVGLRPRIELEPADHPLAAEQRDGIPVERLRAIVGPHLHHGHPDGSSGEA
jgi:hypothetical protein